MKVDQNTTIEIVQRCKKIIEKVEVYTNYFSYRADEKIAEKIKEFLPIFQEKDCLCKSVSMNRSFSLNEIKFAISPILTEREKTLESIYLEEMSLDNYYEMLDLA